MILIFSIDKRNDPCSTVDNFLLSLETVLDVSIQKTINLKSLQLNDLDSTSPLYVTQKSVIYRHLAAGYGMYFIGVDISHGRCSILYHEFCRRMETFSINYPTDPIKLFHWEFENKEWVSQSARVYRQLICDRSKFFFSCSGHQRDYSFSEVCALGAFK